MILPIRTVIADDEPLARAGLRALLASDPEIEIVAECGDGGTAIETTTRLSPELLLLDIQMPDANGFGVLQQLCGARAPVVVFVTAHDRFAVDAFAVAAVDYLLKPFSDERFAAAIARAKGAVHSRRNPASLVVRAGGDVVVVRVEDIDWISAADYYVKLHVGGRTYMLREALRSLERRLDPRCFVRIHRSAIVNVNRIRTIRLRNKGELEVVLHDGMRLRMNRGRRAALERLLRQRSAPGVRAGRLSGTLQHGQKTHEA